MYPETRNRAISPAPCPSGGLPARWPRSSVSHVAAGELTPAARHKRYLWLRLRMQERHPHDEVLLQQVERRREQNHVLHQERDVIGHCWKAAGRRGPAIRHEWNEGDGHHEGDGRNGASFSGETGAFRQRAIDRHTDDVGGPRIEKCVSLYRGGGCSGRLSIRGCLPAGLQKTHGDNTCGLAPCGAYVGRREDCRHRCRYVITPCCAGSELRSVSAPARPPRATHACAQHTQ